MKKMTKCIAMIVIGILLMVGLAACGGNETTPPIESPPPTATPEPTPTPTPEPVVEAIDMANHLLVGTWDLDASEHFYHHRVIYNADGTGIVKDHTSSDSFIWEPIERGRYVFIRQGEEREEWAYSMRGEMLVLTCPDGIDWFYVSADPDSPMPEPMEQEWIIDPALVGIWAWEEDLESGYIFDDDGFGIREWDGVSEEFYWWIAAEGILAIETIYGIEEWYAVLVDDVLIMESAQIAGFGPFILIRVY